MNYQTVRDKLRQKDPRNIFGDPLEDERVRIPEEIRSFYKYVNPIDVEVVLEDLTSIKFFSLNELNEAQEEYKLNEGSFVFASREGDPIILRYGKVYTAAHGSGKWKLEQLNSSIEEFLVSLVDSI